MTESKDSTSNKSKNDDAFDFSGMKAILNSLEASIKSPDRNNYSSSQTNVETLNPLFDQVSRIIVTTTSTTTTTTTVATAMNNILNITDHLTLLDMYFFW